MKKWAHIVFVFFLVISFIPMGCGKKGPPFLSVREIPVRVSSLKVVQQEDGLYLKGSVADAQAMNESNITGCKIYHALYPLDDPPCKGCPIDYGFLKEIKGNIVSQKDFSCRVSAKAERGIHFFKVRFVDKEGGIGPFSDAAEVTVE